MYCKLFASLYQGTLRGASHEILVFTNLLAHAGRDGVVDKHFRAIAEETGLTIDEVKAAILTLESPDPESRSPDEDGARLIRMDDHRVWGWKIVNYGKYRAIRSEEDRAEQNRLAQMRWRKRNKPASATVSHDKPRSATVSHDKPRSAQGEGEGEAIENATHSRAPEPEEIYQAYPRKIAKPDAIKAIKKALLKHDAAFLLSRTIAYGKTQAPNDRWTPHPATWFNAERFNDDPATWTPQDIGSGQPAKPKSKSDIEWEEFQAKKKANEAA